MDIPREQFDELLGGREELPSAVSIIKFADARSQEIAALTEAIEDPQNNHLAFQKMPKHLRRRAMSHNVKRMPRRLREVHLSQMEKSGLPMKGKRPSRKYRRRPSNLLKEYNRRQRRAIWLETHIWHAKRFHMTEQWDYKLPNYPNDKGFRACYRATARHCLIQDMSYLNCIELRGPEEVILQQLSQLTNTECGLTFAAKSTLRGTREGRVVMFRKGSYPFNAIGRVSFMWCPLEGDAHRILWIWSHPAFYRELLQELTSIFGFVAEESPHMDVDLTQKDETVSEDVETNFKRKTNVEDSKLEIKNVGKLPKFSNGIVAMTLLKDTLNRFRLTGPLSQVVLTEALKFVNVEFVRPEDKGMDVDSVEEPRSEWLVDFYKNDERLKSLTEQHLFYEGCLPKVNSASELPPRMIASVTVMDPRLSMPSTRTKAVNTGVNEMKAKIPERLSSHAPLWSEAVRDRVTHSKMSAAQLNSLRSRALVPGLATPAWIGHHNISHIPLLLVQNPGALGHAQLGYGSGWDVIAPAGWGMPLWLGLVFRGARPGGLRETDRLSLEMATGPTLQPDTQAGQQLAEQRATDCKNRHFRLPPDKRPNYIKLGVTSPFCCPWERLLQDWCPGLELQGFYIIRHREKLNYIKCLLNKTKHAVTCTISDSDKTCGIVQVGIEMCGRGTLSEYALICTPSKKDLRLKNDKSGRGPKEPLHEDENEEQRKAFRADHVTKLKRLRKKRVKAKRELEEEGVFLEKEKRKVSPTEDIVKEHADLMKELWLPSEVKSVRNSSSRRVIGFVSYGDFSFTQSRSSGYGFVALSALLNVLELNQTSFLVRNVTSLQYYFVRLKILDSV